MNHIQIREGIDTAPNAFASLGTALGLLGGYLWQGRENRGKGKETQDALIGSEQTSSLNNYNDMLSLQGMYGNNAPQDEINKKLGLLSSRGFSGINSSNIDKAVEQAKGISDYWGGYKTGDDYTMAERKANNGAGLFQNIQRNAPRFNLF